MNNQTGLYSAGGAGPTTNTTNPAPAVTREELTESLRVPDYITPEELADALLARYTITPKGE